MKWINIYILMFFLLLLLSTYYEIGKTMNIKFFIDVNIHIEGNRER